MDRSTLYKTEKKEEDITNISRISNLSEFGVYSNDCKVLITKNLKYGVFWNENMVTIVDLDKKDIVSKYLNEMNQIVSKIRKLKITDTNDCVYLKQSSNSYFLVISSIDFMGEHFELSFTDEILEFHYAESVKDTAEYIFLLNENGDLKFIQNFFDLNQTIRANILRDAGINPKILKSKCEMIFIEETDNFILFFGNGALLNYSVSQNPESMKDEKAIFFEEVININRNESNINLGTNQYNLVRFHIINIDEREENEEDMIEDKENHMQTFLILIYTYCENDTIIDFYKLQSNKLVLHNRFDSFKHKNIVDSYIFECIENSYLIIALQDGEKIEFQKAVVLDMINKDENDNPNHNPFSKITEYNEQRSLVCMKILGAYVNYYQNNKGADEIPIDRSSLNLGQNEVNDFSINVYVRRILNINDNNFVCDCEIDSKTNINQMNTSFFLGSTNSEEINDDFYYENTYNIEKLNKALILQYFDKIRLSIHGFLRREFLNIENKEIDFFLLSLIFNNKIFMIRNYIFLKKNNSEFLISNEKMLKTINLYIRNIQEVMFDKIDKHLDDQLFKDNNLKSNLEILIYIYKVIKSRLLSPLKKPYEIESSMQIEETKTIDEEIEKAEKILLVLKIIRSYLRNILSNGNNYNIESSISQISLKRKEYLSKIIRKPIENSNTILEIIWGNLEKYPNLKLILKNIMMSKYSKFQLFFYYFYYSFDLLLAKYTDNYKTLNTSRNLNISDQNLSESKTVSIDMKKTIYYIINDTNFRNELKQFFYELFDEYDNYKDICENLYCLDLNILLRENGSSTFTIDTVIISKFFDLISSENLIKPSHNSKITMFNLIISFLWGLDYKKEALLISRKLIQLSPEIEDLRTQLKILMEQKLNQHAFIFLDCCFATLLYDPDMFKGEKDIKNKLTSLPEFNDYKSLAFTFFEYLLTHDELDFLLSLPFNTFDNDLFMEFLESREEYGTIKLIYLIKCNKVVYAKQFYNLKIKGNQNVSREEKEIYERLIANLELLECNDMHYQKGSLNHTNYVNLKLNARDKLNNSVDTFMIKEDRKDFIDNNGNYFITYRYNNQL
jgi:hypothetical protein